MEIVNYQAFELFKQETIQKFANNLNKNDLH